MVDAASHTIQLLQDKLKSAGLLKIIILILIVAVVVIVIFWIIGIFHLAENNCKKLTKVYKHV